MPLWARFVHRYDRRRIEKLNMDLTVASVLPLRTVLRVPDIRRSLLLVRSVPQMKFLSLILLVHRAYMTAPPRWKLFSCYICAWSMVMSTPLSCCSITYTVSPTIDMDNTHLIPSSGGPAPHCDRPACQPRLSDAKLAHIRAYHSQPGWLVRQFLTPPGSWCI